MGPRLAVTRGVMTNSLLFPWRSAALRLGARVAAAALCVAAPFAAGADAQTLRSPDRPASLRRAPKLDRELAQRARVGSRVGRSRLIVRLAAGQTLPPALLAYQAGQRLELIDGYVLDVPDSALDSVAALADVQSAHFDRP